MLFSFVSHGMYTGIIPIRFLRNHLPQRGRHFAFCLFKMGKGNKKSAHKEEVRHRLCNLVCRYTFLRCGFFVFLSENPPRKGTSYIFVQGRKSFSIFSTSGRELYFPARVWYSPLVTNCSFHDPVYFSGIPPQGLPLRYIQYTT